MTTQVTTVRVPGGDRPPAGFAVALVLTMGAGPLMLYAVTALAPLLVTELGLSRAELGSLAGVTFLAAACCALLGGRLVDRVSTRLVSAAVLIGSAVALGLVTAAVGLVGLLLAAVVSGAAQSLSNPVTNRLVAVHVAGNRVGTLVGIKQSGVQFAQLVAGAVLPAVAAVAGWRTATGFAAVIVLAGLVALRRAVPASPAPSAATTSPSQEPMPTVVWWLFGYTALTAAALQATNVYLPLFAHQELGIGVTAAGLTAAVAGGAGVLARVGWARAAARATGHRRLLVMLTSAAAFGALLLVAAETLALPWLLWPAVLVHGATALGSNAVVMLAVIRAGRAVGRSTGVLAFGLYLGFTLGPVAFGFAVDGRDGFAPAWAAVAGTYLVATLLLLLWAARSRAAPAVR